MSEFIKLTRAYDERKMAVNMSHVETLVPLNPADKGTVIRFMSGSTAEVTETVDQIIDKINKVDQT